MSRRKVLVSSDQAVPALRQHTAPCGDCPWARVSLPGWLGSRTADEWLASAHGEDEMHCHTLLGAQCVGAAVYRRNVCKQPRDAEALRLPADRKAVFASPVEFKAHHAAKKE
jgi:hypothetical protein